MIRKWHLFKTHSLILDRVTRRFTSNNSYLKPTALHDFHVRNGGRMVPFAGFSMPLQYKTSIIQEHNHVRSAAGLFDVSHMMQNRICGVSRVEAMEYLTVADIMSLKENQGTLSSFLNKNGGIIDDLIITKCKEPHLYLVTNAGTSQKVMAHLKYYFKKLNAQGKDIRLESISASLLALQGPKAASIMQAAVSFDLKNLKFMHGCYTKIFGINGCRLTRCGYTGEDGFEISIPLEKTEEIAQKLLKHPDVLPIGLGARDTLRLEAGLCLYGNDITENTTPIEATLAWTIKKHRRVEASPFIGQNVVLAQLKKKETVKKKRIGIISTSGPPPRAGTKIVNSSNKQIGIITSGCVSPFLKLNIAMGYVETKYAKVGTEFLCEIRKKTYPAIVKKMPFVPSNYYF